jgi:hypothetical protein
LRIAKILLDLISVRKAGRDALSIMTGESDAPSKLNRDLQRQFARACPNDALVPRAFHQKIKFFIFSCPRFGIFRLILSKSSSSLLMPD